MLLVGFHALDELIQLLALGRLLDPVERGLPDRACEVDQAHAMRPLDELGPGAASGDSLGDELQESVRLGSASTGQQGLVEVRGVIDDLGARLGATRNQESRICWAAETSPDTR